MGISSVRHSGGRDNIKENIKRLGLAKNLYVVLDIGDSACYPAGSQTWNDAIGVVANEHFLLGSTASVAADDPTRNGTIGARSINDYWSFDGGDQFRKWQANTTFFNNLHKNNALFTLMGWFYMSSAGDTQALFGTNGGVFTKGDGGAKIGLHWEYFDTGGYAAHRFRINKSDGSQMQDRQQGFDTGSLMNRWSMFAISVDEANSSLIMFGNGAVSSLSETYVSPSTASASYSAEICAGGNAANKVKSGTRIQSFCMWDRALSAAELGALFDATRSKFGV